MFRIISFLVLIVLFWSDAAYANVNIKTELTGIAFCETGKDGICKIEEIFSPGKFKNKDYIICQNF